jgi:predicted DCC family thiol-disulfide oxidoreductase YuxK
LNVADESPILVFDGVCVLCNRSVQFVLHHDRARRYRFATSQSATGRGLLTTHGFDPEKPVSVLLLDAGAAYTESTAVLRVLASFGWGWRWLAGAARALPCSWRDRLYRVVATHRYRWFGRNEVCMLRPPDEAARFLD